jgi:uncharacterized membrane protein YqgA involved in biofilm formation
MKESVQELWELVRPVLYLLFGLFMIQVGINMIVDGAAGVGAVCIVGVGVWAGYAIGKQHERPRV